MTRLRIFKSKDSGLFSRQHLKTLPTLWLSPYILIYIFLSVSVLFFCHYLPIHLPLFPIFHLKRKAVCRRQTGPWQQRWRGLLKGRSQTRPGRCSGRDASPQPSWSGSSPPPPLSPPAPTAKAKSAVARNKNMKTIKCGFHFSGWN